VFLLNFSLAATKIKTLLIIRTAKKMFQLAAFVVVAMISLKKCAAFTLHNKSSAIFDRSRYHVV